MSSEDSSESSSNSEVKNDVQDNDVIDAENELNENKKECQYQALPVGSRLDFGLRLNHFYVRKDVNVFVAQN